MAYQLTDIQRKAVESTDGSVLVGAAAGSGKTTVLSQRIVSMLTDEAKQLDASRILVLTFSRSAANEMRQRIKQDLESQIKKEPENLYLRRQQKQLRRATIGTIHAFCAQVLREYFSAADLPPDFTIGEDSFSYSIELQAIQQAAETCYKEMPEKMRLLAASFGRARSDREAQELVQDLYEFEQSVAWPLRWEQQALGEAQKKMPFSQSLWGQYILSRGQLSLGEVFELLNQIAAQLQFDAELQRIYNNVLESFQRQAMALEAAFQAQDWNQIASLLASFQLPKRGPTSEDTDAESLALCDRYRDMAKSILQGMQKGALGSTEEELNELSEKQAQMNEALFAVTDVYRQTLLDLKMERRFLKFDDLESMALRLLVSEEGTPTAIGLAVREQYDQIFVDEFQDTNERQEAIFRAISKDGTNLFYVGDVKQSIYSFRRADPTIFVRIRDEYERSKSPYPQYLSLPENFRSSVPVIDSVNKIFAPLMTSRFGGVDYTKGEALVKGTIEGEVASPDTVGMEIYHLPNTPEEQTAVAAKLISRMLKEGTPVADGGQLRPCRPDDFCILYRSPQDLGDLCRDELVKEGIPCNLSSKEDFFYYSEVATFLALLRVVDNPIRDIDLATVMLSPIGDFTMDELTQLRLGNRRSHLWPLLLVQQDEKSLRFCNLIRGLRQKSAMLAVDEFVSQALKDTEAEVILTAPPETERRQRRLRTLITYAAEYIDHGGKDLREFLRHCEIAAENKKGPALEELGGDGVTITTIHKSKGLQWPFVLLMDTQHQFNLMDIRQGATLMDTQLGIGSKLRVEEGNELRYRQSGSFYAIARKREWESKEEELRVLYVALTRAKQKNFLFASLALNSNGEDKRSEWARKLSCELTPKGLLPQAAFRQMHFWSWISLALLCDGFLPIDFSQGQTQRGAIRLNTEWDEEAATDAAEEAIASKEEVEKLVQKLDKRLKAVYPYQEATQLPTKITVTQLTHQEKDTKPYFSEPSFTRGNQPSAVERGNAMHLFMQVCDIQRAAANPQAEVQRLLDAQYMDERTASCIRPQEVQAFFANEIGKRMLAAPKVLREYSFVDSIPAKLYRDVGEMVAEEPILLQGTADCILVGNDSAVLIDYKTDRIQEMSELVERYQLQLALYRHSLNKILPVPITHCYLYSFHLCKSIEVPESALKLKNEGK